MDLIATEKLTTLATLAPELVVSNQDVNLYQVIVDLQMSTCRPIM